MVEVLTRSYAVTMRKRDDRTFEASLSSETVVERFFGGERLVHTTEAVDLTRARDGLPLLFNHDPDEPIGLVQGVRVEDRKLRGTLRFGNSRRAQELAADAADGLVRNMSISYRPIEMEPDPDEDDVYNVTRWEVLEASITPIPADPAVGIGRSYGDITMENEETTLHLSRSERRREKRAREEERRRVHDIMALGEKYDVPELAARAVEGGWTVEQMTRQILDEMERKQGPTPNPMGPLGDLDMSPREADRFSFVRAIRAQMDPKYAMRECGFELECSRAVAQKLGREPQGLFVPLDVQTRVMSVGTATAGGYLKGTDHLADSFIDMLRDAIVIESLGATVLDGLQGDVDIPRQDAQSTAYWVAEGGAPTTSQPTMGQLLLSPKTVGGFTDMTRKLILQSSPQVEDMVRRDLAQVLAAAIDRVAINGGGTNEPVGILQTTGIGAVSLGANGGPPTWASIVNLIREVAIDNALEGNLAFLTNAAVVATLRQTAKVSGTDSKMILEESELLGYPVRQTNLVPSNLTKGTGTNLSAMIFGNFRDVILAYWSALDLLVDPYTLGTSGGVRVIAFRDVDIGIRHAQSFAAIQDMVTS